MLTVNLLMDVRNAMEANAVSTMADHIFAMIDKLKVGKTPLRILPNMADKRLVSITETWNHNNFQLTSMLAKRSSKTLSKPPPSLKETLIAQPRITRALCLASIVFSWSLGKIAEQLRKALMHMLHKWGITLRYHEGVSVRINPC